MKYIGRVGSIRILLSTVCCICSFYRNHYTVLSTFMTCHRVCNKSNTTGAFRNLGEIRLPKTFSVLCFQPNLVTSPIKGILEIQNLTPCALRSEFRHGRIVSDQLKIKFHI